MRILDGKTAWVTGSSRGLGRAIAEALAEAGCRVAVHGRNRTNLRSSGEGDDLQDVARAMAERHGVEAMAVCGELTDENEVRRCADEIRARFGRVDILVANAGGTNLTGGEIKPGDVGRRDRASDFCLDQFRRMIDLNLLPTALCCRECVGDMRAAGWGRIVAIGSIAGCGGHKTGGRSHAAYSLAKAAVHQYARILAAELRPDGIPVNCLVAGNINTPSTRLRYGGDREDPKPGLSRLEHVGVPDDIARTALFLCGPGGEYISGQCLRVDGGEQLSPC